MRVAIAGGGSGGLTLALCLRQHGHDVDLIEQASSFGEVGAGVQLSPNGARVLVALGLAGSLARIGTVPERTVVRRWADDRELMVSGLGHAPVERYGHGYYNVYRPDLIEMLAAALDGVQVHFGVPVTGARASEPGPALELADGTAVGADVVVGADGIHSAVRTSRFGPEPARFSGWLAYRALVPRHAVPHLPLELTVRLGPDRHLVSYFVGRDQRYYNLVCVVPEAAWDVESWMEPGSADDLRAQFERWAPGVAALLDHVVEPVYKWALHDREPLETWSDGLVTLLGDACHPMLPFMAQGACQAIEDAAVLARCLDEWRSDLHEALQRYEALRRPRTAKIQAQAWQYCSVFHLPDGEQQQARDRQMAASSGQSHSLAGQDWLYGYDALAV
jgi:salicylate hydroxylase